MASDLMWRVTRRLQVGDTRVREQRHPGVTAAASHTHQGDRVCLEDAEHVEYFLEADPVQAELLGEKGKDELNIVLDKTILEI